MSEYQDVDDAVVEEAAAVEEAPTQESILPEYMNGNHSQQDVDSVSTTSYDSDYLDDPEDEFPPDGPGEHPAYDAARAWVQNSPEYPPQMARL